MMLTPGLMLIAPRLADMLAGQQSASAQAVQESDEGESHLKDHLIIVGFGISGKHLAHVAKESGIEYTILEMNPETVSRYRHKEPIAHGDASQPVVLEHLGVTRARVLVIVISDPSAVRAITIAVSYTHLDRRPPVQAVSPGRGAQARTAAVTPSA